MRWSQIYRGDLNPQGRLVARCNSESSHQARLASPDEVQVRWDPIHRSPKVQLGHSVRIVKERKRRSNNAYMMVCPSSVREHIPTTIHNVLWIVSTEWILIELIWRTAKMYWSVANHFQQSSIKTLVNPWGEEQIGACSRTQEVVLMDQAAVVDQ